MSERSVKKTDPGILSSRTGIVCNICLFAVKSVLAVLSGSVAVLSDAFNNLSDCTANIISLFGYRMSSRPADSEHPFGHGRIEYLVSLITEGIIFLLAYELFTESIRKIISPTQVNSSLPVFLGLFFSILVKLGMYVFNLKLSRQSDSLILRTTAQDSRNDALTTSAAMIALVLMPYTDLPLDGILGTVIAVFIFISGCNIAREIIGRLIGTSIDPEKSEEILRLIREDPEILGVHDLIVHDYGNERRMGSAHCELDASLSFREAHEIADRTEKRIRERTGIDITLHMDPAELKDKTVSRMYRHITDAVREISPAVSVHDLQKHPDGSWELDVLVPFALQKREEEIRRTVADAIRAADPDSSFRITLDHPYDGGRS